VTKDSHFETKVIEISDLGENYIYLALARPEGFAYLPGQYTFIIMNDKQGEHRAYYSIASSPNQHDRLEFCVTRTNNIRQKQFYSQLSAGAKVIVGAPASANLANATLGPAVIAFAGGSGIAPIRSILNALQETNITLVYGCRHGAERPFHKEFATKSETDRGFVYKSCADQVNNSDALEGKVTDFIEEVFQKEAHYLLCGPKPMLEALESRLINKGIDKTQIHYDGF
tara:strand:+ start:1603 stop:2286 length:684 start_codon:yes stop_codon:yes gene_type:complete